MFLAPIVYMQVRAGADTRRKVTYKVKTQWQTEPLPKMTFGLLLISHFFSNLYSKKEVFSQSTTAQNLQKATFSS